VDVALIAAPVRPGDFRQRLSEALPRSQWRMETPRPAPTDVTTVNDAYNADPHSMRHSLTALASMTGGPNQRCVAVLGRTNELGDDARTAHQEIGQYAAQLGVDQIILVAGGEEAGWMLEGVRSAGGKTLRLPCQSCSTGLFGTATSSWSGQAEGSGCCGSSPTRCCNRAPAPRTLKAAGRGSAAKAASRAWPASTMSPGFVSTTTSPGRAASAAPTTAPDRTRPASRARRYRALGVQAEQALRGLDVRRHHQCADDPQGDLAASGSRFLCVLDHGVTLRQGAESSGPADLPEYVRRALNGT
jgi:hypothetical protein